jgi:hypothetical protein
MTPTAFTTATAWLIATLMMFFGDVAMASSLRLADPSELAGKWQIHQHDEPVKVCTLDLAQNQTLGGELECIAGWLGETPVGWFPEPDGISLTGKEGSRIIHLGRQKEGLYQATLKSGTVLILQRTL